MNKDINNLVLDTFVNLEGEDLTIREYFVELMLELWKEGESFSGKRPFGNSGWEHDIYAGLIEANHIKGTIDEDGYIDELDDDQRKKADKMILKALQSMAG